MRSLRILSVVGTSALLLSAGVAFAEDRPTDVTQRVEVRSVRAVAATTTREVAKARAEAAREEAKKRMEISREEAKARIKAAHEETKVRREAQREKVAERLAVIQDKVKQQSAEKIAAQFERLNKTWTDHFLQLLERYDEVLQKMRDRAGVAAGGGSDVSAADTAIQSASAAIESARTAVVAQAAKTYVLDTSAVTTTTATSTASGHGELMKGLRTAFQELHRSLFSDLFALRDGVMKDARTAVRNALQTLSNVPKVDDDDDADDSDDVNQ